MKKTSLILTCVLAAFLTGCGTAAGIFSEEKTVVPVVSEIIRTNEVAEVITDGGLPVATNVFFVVEKAYATNFVTNSTFVVSTKTGAAIGGAQTLAPLAPQPWGGLATAGLGLLAAVLGIVAKIKSDKAAIVPAIIQAVEIANDPKVKELINSHATAAGVEAALHSAVKKLT